MSEPGEQGLISRVGPLEIDWPRTVGYYGGVSAAVVFGVIEWPVGLFIAAVPFFKMLQRPDASRAERTVGQVLDGAALPVGGDSPSAIRPTGGSSGSRRLAGPIGAASQRVRSEMSGIWRDAQALRNGGAG